MKVQVKELAGKDDPNYIVACIGGGSNAIGSFYHYLNNENVKLIAVEAAGKGVASGETAARLDYCRKEFMMILILKIFLKRLQLFIWIVLKN